MRVEVQLYSFFNLDARWDGWSTPRPGRFTPGKDTRYPLCRRLGAEVIIIIIIIIIIIYNNNNNNNNNIIIIIIIINTPKVGGRLRPLDDMSHIRGYSLLTGTVTIWTYYEHVPERVINVNGTTTMWDVLVITDRTVPAN